MTFNRRLWRDKLFHLGIVLSIGILRYGSEWVAFYFDIADFPAFAIAGALTILMWVVLVGLYRRATITSASSPNP